ncbi:hypothetical protein Tco_0567568 [Tanacetum coccineum]
MWRGAKQPYNKGLQRGMPRLQQEKSIKAQSTVAAVCFMQLELRLQKKHENDYLKDVENGQFELPYPPIKNESFSIGAFSHPEITHDKHERSFCKDLAIEQKNVTGLGTSTADHGGDYKHLKMDHPISCDSVKCNNPKGKGENSVQVVSVHPKEDGTESKTKETDVEVSDDGSAPILDELDIEKHNQEVESEAVKEDGERDNTNPQSVNHLPESSGASQSSSTQAAPNGLTEVAAASQASVTLSSPKSILEREFLSDPNFVNDNNTREADS